MGQQYTPRGRGNHPKENKQRDGGVRFASSGPITINVGDWIYMILERTVRQTTLRKSADFKSVDYRGAVTELTVPTFEALKHGGRKI